MTTHLAEFNGELNHFCPTLHIHNRDQMCTHVGWVKYIQGGDRSFVSSNRLLPELVGFSRTTSGLQLDEVLDGPLFQASMANVCIPNSSIIKITLGYCNILFPSLAKPCGCHCPNKPGQCPIWGIPWILHSLE